MAGTIKRMAGPAYLAGSATNIYTPAASTIGAIIRHIHIANVTSGAVTFTLYVGGTGGSTGGTELFKGYSVAANSTFDHYCALQMISTDFLSGLASAGTSLTITVEGEEYVVNSTVGA
jgi:hypothetical protein